MYDADDPSSGAADFASLNVGTNGALEIATTSVSDADISLEIIEKQMDWRNEE